MGRAKVSSNPVGTVYRCLDCPGVVTFDTYEKAMDHRETTMWEAEGAAHRVEPLLQVKPAEGEPDG